MVNFTTKEPGGSNKPPKPTPLPEPPIFLPMKLIHGPWGSREVWVSVPLPDRLTFTVPLTDAIYGPGMPKHNKPDRAWKMLRTYLLTEAPDRYGVKVEWAPKGGVNILTGPRGSKVTIHRWPKGKRPIRIECNPRKLGPAGFAKMEAILGGPTGLLDMKKVKLGAKLTKLDIAVDVVGMEVSELVAWHSEQGKRRYYTGKDGQLETIYIHAKAGDEVARVRIYDRVRDKLDKGKAPPFGEAPVTRIEIIREHFGQQPYLSYLLKMKDQFGKLRVGYWRSQTDETALAEKYLSLRRTLAIARTGEMLGISEATLRIALKHAETVPVPNLIDKKVNWASWAIGLEATGLTTFLDF